MKVFRTDKGFPGHGRLRPALAGAGLCVFCLLVACRKSPSSRQEPATASAEQRQAAAGASAEKPVEADRGVVVGTIRFVSKVPDPKQVPYKDCVTFVVFRIDQVEQGVFPEKKLLVVFWGMRDRVLQPAARFRPGQRQRLTIRPFAEMTELARVMQADDTEEYDLTPYWVVRYEAL